MHTSKHMILSVSHSPKSVCAKFTIVAKTTLINQQ